MTAFGIQKHADDCSNERILIHTIQRLVEGNSSSKGEECGLNHRKKRAMGIDGPEMADQDIHRFIPLHKRQSLGARCGCKDIINALLEKINYP